jgi:hypothetical protein
VFLSLCWLMNICMPYYYYHHHHHYGDYHK